jgi:pimeloyl-[acyl-carrier protein] methyl ester esterase
LSAAPADSVLYSETSGSRDAAPLVLLHGWGLNLRVFDGLRVALGVRHRVTAIDLPGHGRSPWIAGSSAQQQLDELAAMLPSGATLVGWSLGGQLALQLASLPSLAVQRLVLIASSARFVRAHDWPHGIAAATLRDFAARLERDADQTVAEFLDLQVRGSSDAAAVRATLQRSLQQHGAAAREALRAGLALLEHNDLRELARRIDIPALLIAGQYDRVTPPAGAQALAQLLPQAQLLQISRAGHAPLISHPEQVGAALLDFMRDAPGPRPAAEPRVSA